MSALVLRHFDTRYGARDDAAHLATYAPEAYLVVSERAVQKAQLPPQDVLAAWQGVKREREPQFGAASLLELRADGVAFVDLREVNTGSRLYAAVGLLNDQVEFATLIDGPSDPRDYATLRMTALSEMASLKAMRAFNGDLTSLLEVAYVRRHGIPKVRLLALPETHFSCAGSGACCRHELTIGLDDNSVTFLEAVEWPTGPGPYTVELPAEAAGLVTFRHKLAREEDGRCRFLTPDNRCLIHAMAGRAVFKPCHVFPYRFTWSPDGICVTTNSMCPTARFAKGQPLAAQEPDLRSRLAVADVARAEKFYVKPGQEVEWEVFRVLEGQLLELLLGPAPIKQKLWVALRWLEARLADPNAGVPAAWYDEPIPKLGWLQRSAFKRFGKLFDPCFKDLAGLEAGEGVLPEHEEELTRFFRSLLFSKVTTYPYGLVAGLNYLALVYHVLERQAERHAGKGISEAFWREFYAVVTSGTFFRILEVCHRLPATGLARNAGSPAFGLSLLRV